jgi:hypothetical protein
VRREIQQGQESIAQLSARDHHNPKTVAKWKKRTHVHGAPMGPNMNRTLKEATVKKYHYRPHQHLKEHLHAFLMAHNFAKRLKTLNGVTSYEHIQLLATRPRTIYHQSAPSEVLSISV